MVIQQENFGENDNNIPVDIRTNKLIDRKSSPLNS